MKSVRVFLHTQNDCAGLDGYRKARVAGSYCRRKLEVGELMVLEVSNWEFHRAQCPFDQFPSIVDGAAKRWWAVPTLQ